MPKYIVTDRAGRYVAGVKNPSAGSTLDISEDEARYELILGTIVPAPEASLSVAEPVPVPPEVELTETEMDSASDAPAEKPTKKKR